MELIKRLKEDSKFPLVVMAVFAAIVLSFFFFWAGLVIFFFVALVVWVAFFFVYFRYLFEISFVFRILIFVLLFFLTLGLLYKAVPERFGGKKKVAGEVVNGITLVPCTKTLSDQPQRIAGLNTELYSGALSTNSVDPKDANNVRTFSLKGLNDKTEANSFFSNFRMADGSPITGYDDGMEVCNSDNKTNVSYNTASNDDEDIVTEDNVTARTHYFHGGKYIPQPGVYRVDQFVRDKADGKWKLVNRVENITITE